MDGEEIDTYILETKILAGMTEEDRAEYVNEVILWLSGRLEYVLKADSKIQMARRSQRAQKEVKGRAEEITICALFSIKPEHREAWMKLIGTLVGMEEKDKTEKTSQKK